MVSLIAETKKCDEEGGNKAKTILPLPSVRREEIKGIGVSYLWRLQRGQRLTLKENQEILAFDDGTWACGGEMFEMSTFVSRSLLFIYLIEKNFVGDYERPLMRFI